MYLKNNNIFRKNSIDMKNKKIILSSTLTLFISVILFALNYGINKKTTTQKAKIKIIKQELNQQQIAYLFSSKQFTSKCGEGKCGEGKEKNTDSLKKNNQEKAIKVTIKKKNSKTSEAKQGRSAGHKKGDKKKKKKKKRKR